MLRPIRDGAVWNYQGVHTRSTGAPPVAYTTRTTHSASSGESVLESYSNAEGDGPYSQTLSISGGEVATVESVDFAGKGVFETIRFTELRSPVRQNDQFTIHDRRYADTSIDADGDGKPDALDVAIFGRVAGVETLSLAGLPPLSTVRVDLTARSRVIFSSDGRQSLVLESSYQIWYARGIGIVRQRGTNPTPSGTDVSVTDEQLASWDGVTEGFGAMARRSTPIPLNAPPSPVLSLAIVGAAAYGDHGLAVVAGGVWDPGTTVLRLDSQGRIVSWRLHPDLPADQGLIVPHAAGMLHVRHRMATTPFTSLSSTVELNRLDTEGALIGSVGGSTVDLAGSRINPSFEYVRAAVDGSTLWLLWQRIYNTPTAQERELILRPYSLDGASLGPELVVDNVATLAQQISAVGGRVLIGWVRIAGAYDAAYASVALGDPSVSRRPLAAALSGQVASMSQLILPVRLGLHGALLWTAPMPDTPSNATAGVLLDGSLNALRAGPTPADDVLAGVPRLRSYAPAATSTPDGSRLVMAFDTGVHWLTVAAGAPLSTSPLHRVAMIDFQADRQLVFGDRAVQLRVNAGRLETVVVWLNSGAVP